MIKMTLNRFLLAFCSFLLAGFYFPLQSIGSVQEETEVMLSAFVEPKQIPLNRHIVFTVRISWKGDLDLIEMGEVDEPLLSNFDIVGTSTANRVSGVSGGRQATKEITYTLQPKTLGMAYIESVRLSYEDKTSGKTHALRTQRIGVEVISPVRDAGDGSNLWYWIIPVCIVLFGFVSFLLIRFRRSEKKDIEEAVERIVEESYLEDLKNTVDLKAKDRREAFTVLTKIFRKYLSEKYQISALEATTAELLKMLADEGFDESLIRKCETLLTKADVVKFSGQEATQAELDEAYTTVETILESHLAKAKEKQLEMEGEKTGKRKKRKK